MSLERLYTISFESVSVSAVQDLFALKCSSSNGAEIRRISLSAGGVTSPAEIRLRLKRLPSTVTIGSGGSTPTVQKVSSRNGQSSLMSNARTNDTTQASTSGTAQTLAVWQWNVLQEFLEVPPTEGERWECDSSEALIFDLVAAPGSATTLSGYIVWKEV
jgi:hypothetical protein